ncbi:MAG: hypothetical protein K0Q94_4054 [Paenibacillus sp.]|jgi:hypothetical protein|nr:hypothetical protein [Paenibacillus sp.]
MCDKRPSVRARISGARLRSEHRGQLRAPDSRSIRAMICKTLS